VFAPTEYWYSPAVAGLAPVEVEVQGFKPLARPVLHLCFADQDRKNAGVAPDTFCVPNILYRTSSSSGSRGSSPAFRRCSVGTAMKKF
ncbi:hypothetical protein HAX54_033191, partial [Datura stramonium]|nr:hypothetical protein [Datura stramonium]